MMTIAEFFTFRQKQRGTRKGWWCVAEAYWKAKAEGLPLPLSPFD